MNRQIRLLLPCLALVVVGCATQPVAKQDPRDPYERVNRATYKFNDALDRAVAKPLARGYRKVTPQFVQTGVRNFMDNIEYPTVIVNDLLQWKIKHFFSDTARLVLNSTVGIGGLLDPASDAGLDKNDEDFGLTLGKWGVHPGPYVMLPFLGPSDVRDAIGKIPDEFTDGRYYIKNNTVRWSLWGLGLLDTRARLLDSEAPLENVYDKYAFIRNVYLQHRQYLVTGGDTGAPPDQDPLLDDSDSTDKPASGAKPAPPNAPAGGAPPPH